MRPSPWNDTPPPGSGSGPSGQLSPSAHQPLLQPPVPVVSQPVMTSRPAQQAPIQGHHAPPVISLSHTAPGVNPMLAPMPLQSQNAATAEAVSAAVRPLQPAATPVSSTQSAPALSPSTSPEPVSGPVKLEGTENDTDSGQRNEIFIDQDGNLIMK
jgi:hypothetical protein